MWTETETESKSCEQKAKTEGATEMLMQGDLNLAPDHRDRDQTARTTWDSAFHRQFCSCNSLSQAWTAIFQLFNLQF